MLIPNFNMESPKFQMQRIWGSSYKSNRTSPELIEEVYSVEVPKAAKKKQAVVELAKASRVEKPVAKKEDDKNNDEKINNTAKQQPKVEVKNTETEKKGFFSKLSSIIFGSEDKKEAPAKTESKNHNKNDKPQQKHNNENKAGNHNKGQNDKKDFNKKPRPENANKNEGNNSQKQERAPRDNEQRNNNRNDRNNDRDGDRNKNRRNDKFDKKPASNRSNSNRSSNINVNNAEEVVDITKVKYEAKVTTSQVDNIKKVISKTPEEFVSVMVKDVLDNYDSLKDDGSAKVTTEDRVKTHKYLRFETVSVDSELNPKVEEVIVETKKAEVEVTIEAKKETSTAESSQDVEKTKKEQTKKITAEKKPAKQTKVKAKVEDKTVDTKAKTADSKVNTEAKVEAKPEATKTNNEAKAEKKEETQSEFITYSPAVDFESQSIK